MCIWSPDALLALLAPLPPPLSSTFLRSRLHHSPSCLWFALRRGSVHEKTQFPRVHLGRWCSRTRSRPEADGGSGPGGPAGSTHGVTVVTDGALSRAAPEPPAGSHRLLLFFVDPVFFTSTFLFDFFFFTCGLICFLAYFLFENAKLSNCR